MARRYIRDAQGRFAEVPGSGVGPVKKFENVEIHNGDGFSRRVILAIDKTFLKFGDDQAGESEWGEIAPPAKRNYEAERQARTDRRTAAQKAVSTTVGLMEQTAAAEKRMAAIRQNERDKAKARREARNSPEAKAARSVLEQKMANSPAIKQLQQEVASGAVTVDPSSQLAERIAKIEARKEAKRARARARRAKAKG